MILVYTRKLLMEKTYPFSIKWVQELLEEHARLLAVARAAKALVEETPLQDYYLYIHELEVFRSGLADALAAAEDLL